MFSATREASVGGYGGDGGAAGAELGGEFGSGLGGVELEADMATGNALGVQGGEHALRGGLWGHQLGCQADFTQGAHGFGAAGDDPGLAESGDEAAAALGRGAEGEQVLEAFAGQQHDDDADKHRGGQAEELLHHHRDRHQCARKVQSPYKAEVLGNAPRATHHR